MFNQNHSSYCLICDDRASGIHFGVLTCEACKAFYRRTSTALSTIPLPCSPNRCEINIHNRNNCPSCRFDKCKRLGMDRENVIYGKPSKQQQQLSFYQMQRLNQIFHELINSFQMIEEFSHRVFDVFYEQTSSVSDHQCLLTLEKCFFSSLMHSM